MKDIPIDEAQLVAIVVESILYGIYMMTLGACLRIWLRPREYHRRRHFPWILGGTTLLLTAIATTDVALGLYHAILAFIRYQGPGGPAALYSNISSWINVTKTTIAFSAALIVDAFLIYRCWVVCHGHWLVIVVPTILWLGEASCTGVIIYYIATMRKHASFVQVLHARSFYIAVTAMNVVLNVLTTGCIAYRIWSISRGTSNLLQMSSNQRSVLHRAYRILIEAAFPYLVCNILLFVTTFLKSNAAYIVSDAMLMIISINFNLITIRVQRRPRHDSTTRTELTSLEFAPSQNSRQQFGTITQATETTVAVSHAKKDIEFDIINPSKSFVVMGTAV